MSMLIRASLPALAMGARLNGPLAINVDRHPVTDLAPPGARAVVLFFTASDCPICNRYIPEVRRIAKQFEPLGVRVWFVYPNPGDDAKVIRAHDLEFAIAADTALDTRQTLTRMAQVTVTPRYLALGVERPQATHHDLEEAISAVLADKPVPQPAAPAIGCSIVTRQP
jgi:peroxiredoxin